MEKLKEAVEEVKKEGLLPSSRRKSHTVTYLTSVATREVH